MAAAGGTVRIVGLRETQRAFARMTGGMDAALRAGLHAAVEPIVLDIRRKEIWPGASVSTIGPAFRARGVAVTQRKRKVTGKRGDYGSLQMTHAFIPGLQENAEETEQACAKALDVLFAHVGGFH